jgi:hypothetical protein
MAERPPEANPAGTLEVNKADGNRTDSIHPHRWSLRVTGDTTAALVFPWEQPGVARVNIVNPSSEARYDVQLNLADLTIEPGHHYQLRFRARADQPRTIAVGLAQAHEPWDGLGFYVEVELAQRWREFQFDFSPAQAEPNARLHFDLGGAAIAVEVADILFHG